MNKNLGFFILSLILVLILVPMVSAQGTFAGVEKVFVDFATWAVGDAEWSAAKIQGIDRFWALLAAWAITYGLFLGAVLRLPTMSNHKKGAGVVAFFIAVIGAVGSPLPILLWNIGGVLIMIVILVALFFLVAGLWRGSSSANANVIKAQREAENERKRLYDAQKLSSAAKHDRDQMKDNLSGEKTALAGLKDIMNRNLKMDQNLIQKLEVVKSWLTQLAGAGSRTSPEAIEARNRIINQIKTLIPAQKEETEGIRKLRILTKGVEKFDVKEFKEEKDAAAIEAKLKNLAAKVAKQHKLIDPKKGSPSNQELTEAGIDLKKISDMSRKIYQVGKKKLEIVHMMEKLENAILADDQKFNSVLNQLMQSLQDGDFDTPSSLIQNALNLKFKEERELGKVSSEIGALDKLDALEVREILAEEDFIQRFIKLDKDLQKKEGNVAKFLRKTAGKKTPREQVSADAAAVAEEVVKNET